MGNELEIALDHANKANSEAHKSIKRFQGQLRDVEGLFEDESRQRVEIAEKAGLADRRVHALQAEIDDSLAQAKASEEKAKRAMVDAARLADELRAEQDHTATQAKAKRALEAQITELEMRLGEANELAAKGGRTAMAKLETRIRELEIELGSTQAKTGENFKSFQKAERHVKELQFQHDEDKKNQDRMSELAVKLQQKIKTYKAQQDLEENEERAKMAGAALQVSM